METAGSEASSDSNTTTPSGWNTITSHVLLSAPLTGLVRGVIVTLQGTKANGCVNGSGEVYDFVSRYFAPWVGISEDPVTGEF